MGKAPAFRRGRRIGNVHHVGAEAALVVQHGAGWKGVRRPDARRQCPGRRSTRQSFHCDAVVIKLQGDPDHVVALLLQQRAAVTDRSTPPDIATTTRVSAGDCRCRGEFASHGRAYRSDRPPRASAPLHFLPVVGEGPRGRRESRGQGSSDSRRRDHIYLGCDRFPLRPLARHPITGEAR